MYVLSISDDSVQTFGFDMDLYPARMTIKCPQIDCGLPDVYPVLDLYLDGYNPIYGIPLIPNVDILSRYITGGCLPIDLGALFVLPDVNGNAGCQELSNGTAALVYIGGPEAAFLSLYGQ